MVAVPLEGPAVTLTDVGSRSPSASVSFANTSTTTEPFSCTVASSSVAEGADAVDSPSGRTVASPS